MKIPGTLNILEVAGGDGDKELEKGVNNNTAEGLNS